ncbi:MAG: tetratricopeptide repeat protein [Pyrinomonadaceae bacterium]|nr:tetratricopeptide repeat protein [Pyrinomonadaceae bacterium]
MNRQLPTIVSHWACSALLIVSALAITHCCHTLARAQSEDAFSDSAADPVKLFERGQNAHARGDLAKALELYEEAIKLRPDFPEAEFQRGSVLASLGRSAESEQSLRRVIELRKDWPLPYTVLGTLLVRLNRDAEAELQLRQAIKLDSQNSLALRVLADVRLRAGDAKEALQLATRATNDQEAPLATWLLRAQAERRTGNRVGALVSLDHVLKIEPLNLFALLERAEIRIAGGDIDRALADLKSAEALINDDKAIASRVAAAYQLAGRPEEARRIAQAAGLLSPEPNSPAGEMKVIGSPEEIEAANSDDPLVARAALEKLLKKNPDNPMLLARLGDSYRTADPTRALEFYRRATLLQPANADYATGYSSALVQARRFPEAVGILRRVIKFAPDNYAAHANLATALYRLKQFPEALVEYQWLLRAKPDLTVAHYFIATAHDYLGEYEPALTAYELFLAGADAKTNQLEIDKVRLRLPTLRRQIKLGQSAKRKPVQ